MRRVFTSDFYTVELDDRGIAHVVRTKQAFASIDEVRRANGELVAAVVKLPGLTRVLVDLSGGPPGRNDPEFERASDEIRSQLGRFERVAILVRTAAGKLQAKRLSATSNKLQIFQDQAEALAFLCG